MRLTKTTIAILAASISVAQAAEDGVMVDLSVLDNLNGSYIAPSEPLFPVLPKAVSVPSKKINKVSQKSLPVQKVKPAIPEQKSQPIVELKSSEPSEDVVVVDVEPTVATVDRVSLPENKADVKLEADKKVAEQDIKNKAVQEEIIIPVAKVDIDIPAKAEEEVAQTKVESSPNSNANNLPEKPVVPSQEKESVLDNSQQVMVENNNADGTLPAGENLLVADQPNVAMPDNAILFAEDVDELTEGQMADIDQIVSSFKNGKNSKVAIYAHNVNNVPGSFRKKRISLNRAIEIRSYLLKKGFKNFSIKVVNINEDSPKVNTVELSEI